MEIYSPSDINVFPEDLDGSDFHEDESNLKKKKLDLCTLEELVCNLTLPCRPPTYHDFLVLANARKISVKHIEPFWHVNPDLVQRSLIKSNGVLFEEGDWPIAIDDTFRTSVSSSMLQQLEKQLGNSMIFVSLPDEGTQKTNFINYKKASGLVGEDNLLPHSHLQDIFNYPSSYVMVEPTGRMTVHRAPLKRALHRYDELYREIFDRLHWNDDIEKRTVSYDNAPVKLSLSPAVRMGWSARLKRYGKDVSVSLTDILVFYNDRNSTVDGKPISYNHYALFLLSQCNDFTSLQSSIDNDNDSIIIDTFIPCGPFVLVSTQEDGFLYNLEPVVVRCLFESLMEQSTNSFVQNFGNKFVEIMGIDPSNPFHICEQICAYVKELDLYGKGFFINPPRERHTELLYECVVHLRKAHANQGIHCSHANSMDSCVIGLLSSFYASTICPLMAYPIQVANGPLPELNRYAVFNNLVKVVTDETVSDKDFDHYSSPCNAASIFSSNLPIAESPSTFHNGYDLTDEDLACEHGILSKSMPEVGTILSISHNSIPLSTTIDSEQESDDNEGDFNFEDIISSPPPNGQLLFDPDGVMSKSYTPMSSPSSSSSNQLNITTSLEISDAMNVSEDEKETETTPAPTPTEQKIEEARQTIRMTEMPEVEPHVMNNEIISNVVFNFVDKRIHGRIKPKKTIMKQRKRKILSEQNSEARISLWVNYILEDRPETYGSTLNRANYEERRSRRTRR